MLKTHIYNQVSTLSLFGRCENYLYVSLAATSLADHAPHPPQVGVLEAHNKDKPVIDPADFLSGVIRPTLAHLKKALPGMRHDIHVENLLLGTAVQESALRHLFQNDGNDDEYDNALGLYQIESRTHHSIWDNYLSYREELSGAVTELASRGFMDSEERFNNELVTNMAYATAIARLVYLPVPERIPDTTAEQAEYWKKHYNTSSGAGKAMDYRANYQKHVIGALF